VVNILTMTGDWNAASLIDALERAKRRMDAQECESACNIDPLWGVIGVEN